MACKGTTVITIRNRQRKISVNTPLLKANAQKILTTLGYDKFDLGIWLTTNKTIKRYNKRFRKKDKATDILSFPYHTKLKPGDKILVKEPEDQNLGDIIISLEYVKADAPQHDQSLTKRLDVLLAHGIAHLLGYDHKTDKEWNDMQKIEKKLIQTLS